MAAGDDKVTVKYSTGSWSLSSPTLKSQVAVVAVAPKDAVAVVAVKSSPSVPTRLLEVSGVMVHSTSPAAAPGARDPVTVTLSAPPSVTTLSAAGLLIVYRMPASRIIVIV